MKKDGCHGLANYGKAAKLLLTNQAGLKQLSSTKTTKAAPGATFKLVPRTGFEPVSPP